MFRRRKRLRLHERLIALVWPRSGFRRGFLYLGYRIARLPGTPVSVARGLACGVAASFTPLPGLQFLVAGLAAWLLRGNVIASAIATAFVGNPWTFPFIWLWLHKSGLYLLGWSDANLPELSLEAILTRPADALVPMLVGSVPNALLAGTVVFYVAKLVIAASHRRRRERRLSRLRARQPATGGAA